MRTCLMVMTSPPGWSRLGMRSAAQSRPRCGEPGGERSHRGRARRARARWRPDRSWTRRRRRRARLRTEAELEQPVAAARLAVVVALGRRAGEDLDLAVVEAEAAVDRGDLRLDRALVGQEERVGQLSMMAGAMALPSMSASDWVAKTTEAFFLRSVFSHSRSWPAKPPSSSASQPSSTMSSVGRPSSRSSMRWKR